MIDLSVRTHQVDRSSRLTFSNHYTPKRSNLEEDEPIRARAVWLILKSQPEEAIESLCTYYRVDIPTLRVGLPKKHSSVAGCYVLHKKTIYVKNRETLYNPFVILHEFYHHLRSISGSHRGTDKLADSFAINSIRAYNQIVSNQDSRQNA